MVRLSRSSRGQLHTTETIAVLFIFFLLVLFGLIFYVQISKGVVEDKITEITSDKAVTLSLETLFLPELRCSKGENLPVKDCVDLYKLETSIATITDNSDYYFDIFGYADVYIIETYPWKSQCVNDTKHPKGCVLYSRPKPDFTRKIQTPVPIVLYDPLVYDNTRNQTWPEFYFGVLTIDSYS